MADVTEALAPAQSASRPEIDFFDAHAWCLNPILTVRGLQRRIGDVWMSREAARESWQRQECDVNLYLLLCGLSCSIEDYLSYRPWRLTPLARRFPVAKNVIPHLETVLNAPYRLRSLADRRRVRVWKAALDRGVDAVCQALVASDAARANLWGALAADLPTITGVELPGRPSQWRMRIPEAFRCQDMTHHDVMAMAQLACDEFASTPERPVFVVGPRTAGAYFVPLVKAILIDRGFPVSGSLSIRPKEGLSSVERSALRAAGRQGARVVVVDDHPNTGNTFVLVVGLLRELGIKDENVLILAPDHPAQREWAPLVKPVRVRSLEFGAFYKARLLQDDAYLLQSVQAALALSDVARGRIGSNESIDRINSGMRAHFSDGFQVRLKRVFTVESNAPGEIPRQTTVVAKSVGWGWLGYHAKLAADRLAGHVPTVLGFRDGILFLQWVGETDWPAPAPAADAVALRVPAYLAARVRHLSLDEDPTAGGVVGYRWTGREEILSLLRGPYGDFLGRLAKPALERSLAPLETRLPTLVDGRMARENWVQGRSETLKVDFEHHNFGGGEADISDPAYDLAGALYDLRPSRPTEDRLVAEYVALSGDRDLDGRLLLYKLRVGCGEMERAAYLLQRAVGTEKHRLANLRFLAARDFLTYEMNRHHAARLDIRPRRDWSRRIFFLDLDGVFDIQALGYFPHTTPNGLVALGLLQSQDYSVVVNTGRSVEHVRNYCDNYGLPGGIAEYGSILVDRIAGREDRLYGEDVQQELDRCRQALESLPGIHVDPSYKALVRAYRYKGRHWLAMSKDEVDAVMRNGNFTGLKAIQGPTDTIFAPNALDKGSGLRALRERLPHSPELTVVMGDSAQDLSMLELADRAFVPANGSRALRSFVRTSRRAHLTRLPMQRGMLEAVRHLLGAENGVEAKTLASIAAGLLRPSTHPVDAALDAFDQSGPRRLMQVLRRQ